MPDFDRAIAIFHAAREREPSARGGLLDAQCGSDLALRAEVESLLLADERAAGFMDVPAAVASGLAAPDASPLEEGARLGPYLVEREIGRGGMGFVYLAEDERLGRKVALKVLAPAFTRDPLRRERLRQEARAAAALAHPGIATVYALEEVGEHLCLVCEYVRGETLRAEIERQAPALATIVETGVQVARALAAAHVAGVVHRDLKPENVMRDEGGRLRILDFGIARLNPAAPLPVQRLTDAGVLLGTPAYMSPEQLDGSDADQRSDIFALGVLLFELASGRHPFATATPASTAARVLTADPVDLAEINPAMPAGLDHVIRRCLAKKPSDRFQSASDLARALQALDPVAAPPSAVLPHGATPPAFLAPDRWWLVHQVSVMALAAAMVWPVALVHATAGSDWTLALLLAVIATAAVNGTLRAHLLFTWAFGRGRLAAQLARTEPWLRQSDRLFAALLLLSAIPTARTHLVRSAILAAVAFGWTVTSMVIEPATRRAAFPDHRA
jgi:predicted Ser/Thr protein kinase